MPDHAVAVVAATHNRAALLPRLVEALEAQDIDVPFEVVIVDDASTDDTWPELNRLAAATPLPLTIIHGEKNRGPAACRNDGWRHTTAPLVAFTDDDCVPQPGWLRELVDGLGRAGLVQGATVPNPDQAANWGPFTHTIGISRETGLYETCNMGYRRDVLELVGGFDESFQYPFGEDADLAWRAKAQGVESAFLPEAVVYHDVGPSNFGRYLRELRRRPGLVHLLSKHPELRGRTHTGYFYKRSHLPALAVVGSTVALAVSPTSATRWGVEAAAGLWFAYACRASTVAKPATELHWLGVVPRRFLADLIEIGILVKASATYRTLVL